MFQERLRRQVYGFGNRFVRDAPVPFLDNGLPVEPTGDLFQDIGDEDSCAAKRWLAVAHLWIGDDKSPKDFHGLCCLHVLYPFRQSLLSVVLAERAGTPHGYHLGLSGLFGLAPRSFMTIAAMVWQVPYR